uniref:Uncharacterized protein n=1 Tax=Anopheles quadriannulatus TaxID=34691 RepID=A0A182XSG3_ANOQN
MVGDHTFNNVKQRQTGGIFTHHAVLQRNPPPSSRLYLIRRRWSTRQLSPAPDECMCVCWGHCFAAGWRFHAIPSRRV